MASSGSKAPVTLVLIGGPGNGKSATGNSILGKKVFKSSYGFSQITTACEIQTSYINEQVVQVIDTPGYTKSFAEEIGKSICYARDGIHAILLVLSISKRFTCEQEATIRNLQMVFGKNMFNHTIVIFTGADELDENDPTFEEYLAECPEQMQELFSLCGDRIIVFDNKTEDEEKRSSQVQHVLQHVNSLAFKNGNEMFFKGPTLVAEHGNEMFFKELMLVTEHVQQGNTSFNLFRVMAFLVTLKHIEQQCEKEKAAQRKSNLERFLFMQVRALFLKFKRIEQQREKEKAAKRKSNLEGFLHMQVIALFLKLKRIEQQLKSLKASKFW